MNGKQTNAFKKRKQELLDKLGLKKLVTTHKRQYGQFMIMTDGAISIECDKQHEQNR